MPRLHPPRDCPLPLPVLSLAAFFFLRPYLSASVSVSLCLSVSLCSLSFWLCLSLFSSLPGFVLLHVSLCLC